MKFLYCSLLLLLLFQVSNSDIKKGIIPDRFSLGLGLSGFVDMFLTDKVNVIDRVEGAVFVSGFMLAVNIISDNAFGGGDIKLMFAAGFILGMKGNIIALIIGMFLAMLWAFILMLKESKKIEERIVLGPFISMGIFISYIYLYI